MLEGLLSEPIFGHVRSFAVSCGFGATLQKGGDHNTAFWAIALCFSCTTVEDAQSLLEEVVYYPCLPRVVNSDFNYYM